MYATQQGTFRGTFISEAIRLSEIVSSLRLLWIQGDGDGKVGKGYIFFNPNRVKSAVFLLTMMEERHFPFQRFNERNEDNRYSLPNVMNLQQ